VIHSQRFGVTQLEAEIRERNDKALEAWRLRRYMRRDCLDAWPPVWRERLNTWFREQREFANRWMFKNRCQKRAAFTPYSITARSKYPYV
jgi:hypothetical protein